MKVRTFEAKDIDQVAELFYETVHAVNPEHYNEVQLNAWAPKPTPESKKRMCESLLANFSYVVEEECLIIGFGDMNTEGYIDRGFTHKDYQGKGVWSLIFQKHLEDAHRLGLTELTTHASENARPVVEKRGFHLVRAQDVTQNGVTFRNYVMKKTL